MSLAGFEPTIPARDWPQTHALDHVGTGIGGGGGSGKIPKKNKFFLFYIFVIF